MARVIRVAAMARKKAPPTKRGQGVRHVCGWLSGWRVPAPRTRPQIACVELVPWSVRSRTPTVRCQRKCRAVLGGAARQSQEITHLLRNSPEPASSLWAGRGKPNRAGSIRKRDGRWRTERAHKSGVFAAIQHRSNACRRQLTRTKKISVLSVSLLRKVAPLHR